MLKLFKIELSSKNQPMFVYAYGMTDLIIKYQSDLIGIAVWNNSHNFSEMTPKERLYHIQSAVRSEKAFD